MESPLWIGAGDSQYVRARDGSANATQDQRTNPCEKSGKEML